MKYRFIVLMLLAICHIGFAQTLNCDSIKRELTKQISELKKQGQSAEAIKMAEKAQKQILDMYCAGISKVGGMQKGNQQQGNKPVMQGKPTSLNFQSAYQITIKALVKDAGETHQATITYHLPKAGNSMFIPENGVNGTGIIPQQEDGKFDGWLIEPAGKQIIYSTNTEMGKVAFQQITPISSSKPVLNNNKTGKKKNIAGYLCEEIKIIGTDNGKPINMNCWITTTDLPFTSPKFMGISLISAQSLGIANAGKRAALEVNGTDGGQAINFSVLSIIQSSKAFNLSGYKIYTSPF
ncbi:hypothetical protein [Pedobacter sp.]